MSDAAKTLSGPDLASGVEFPKIPDGAMLLGHAHGEAVLLARRGDEVSRRARSAVPCTLRDRARIVE